MSVGISIPDKFIVCCIIHEMQTLLYIIITTLVMSLISLVGVVFLFKNETILHKIVFLLVGLSTGTLLGGAFLHLLPESLESLPIEQVSILILISFSVFFLIEKLLHWHHCHDDTCSNHSIGYMNLIGDSIHNFSDGIIIAAAFAVDIKLGIITGLALMTHELPQELGDFGVLIHAGFKKRTALLANFFVALTSVLGGVVGYFALNFFAGLMPYILPIAAGSFLYISTSDLIPELKKETNISKSLGSFLLFIIGLTLMYTLKLIE